MELQFEPFVKKYAAGLYTSVKVGWMRVGINFYIGGNPTMFQLQIMDSDGTDGYVEIVSARILFFSVNLYYLIDGEEEEL